MTPSPYQQAIYEWKRSGTGHGVVEAVAGSGKTTTLEAVCRLIGPREKGLFVAFNREIVAELVRRKLPENVRVSTIHSFGSSVIRRAVGNAQVEEYKYSNLVDAQAKGLAMAVYGDTTASSLREVRSVLEQLVKFTRLHLVDPRDLTALDECADRFGVDVDPAHLKSYARALAAVLEDGKKLAAKGVIDFVDMLWAPIVLNLPVPPHDTVLVDECQDLNRASLELILRAVGPAGRLLAVGDSRQAIYGFAGADTESFHEISRRTNATKLPLYVSYRCPRKVVELASRYAPIEASPTALEGNVVPAKYHDVFAEARPGDLILSRTNALGIKTVLKFLAKRVPCRMRGRDVAKGILAAMDAADRHAKGDFRKFPESLEFLTSKRCERLYAKEGGEAKAEAVRDIALAIEACLDGFPDVEDYQSFRAAVDGLFADSGNAIWVSSIHRAKGLEAERVFILAHDRLPMKFKNQTPSQALQEVNLLYVAITRSRSTLYLVASEEAATNAKERQAA